MLYIEVANLLRQWIQDDFSINQLLPVEKELEEKYKVSRATIRKAVNKLVEEGIVEKVQGSGTYVRRKKGFHSLHKTLKSGSELVYDEVKNITNVVTDFRVITAETEICEKLGIEENSKIYYIERIRYIDEQPWVFEISYMPLNLFPSLTYGDMEGSKFDYVENKTSIEIKSCRHEIIPVMPDERVNEYLKLDNNQPIIVMKSINFQVSGEPFDYSIGYNKPDLMPLLIEIDRN